MTCGNEISECLNCEKEECVECFITDRDEIDKEGLTVRDRLILQNLELRWYQHNHCIDIFDGVMPLKFALKKVKKRMILSHKRDVRKLSRHWR